MKSELAVEIDNRSQHFLRFQFPMVIWAGLIFLASSIPSAKMPHIGILTYDKLIHGTVFFVFGLLLHRAFEPRPDQRHFPWLRLAIVLFIVMVYGAMDEFHQSFVPGRSVDFFDFLADTIGGVTAVFVLIILSIRREYRKKTSK